VKSRLAIILASLRHALKSWTLLVIETSIES